MEKESLGKVFLRHLVMCIPWGVMVLVVALVLAVGLKQQMKEGIQYTARMALLETSNLMVSSTLADALRQNAKESIEFSTITAMNGIKQLLHDPQVKADLKELVEQSEAARLQAGAAQMKGPPPLETRKNDDSLSR